LGGGRDTADQLGAGIDVDTGVPVSESGQAATLSGGDAQSTASRVASSQFRYTAPHL
jgi:hypothetical protein